MPACLWPVNEPRSGCHRGARKSQSQPCGREGHPEIAPWGPRLSVKEKSECAEVGSRGWVRSTPGFKVEFCSPKAYS